MGQDIKQLQAGPAGVPTGGTTGQLLAKASNADGDDHWVDPPVGGGGAFKIRINTSLPSPYTVANDATNHIIEVFKWGGGAFNVTLPATPFDGQIVIFLVGESQTYNPTVLPNSGQTVENSGGLESSGIGSFWWGVYSTTDSKWHKIAFNQQF